MNGHGAADHYPLGYMLSEARFTQQHINGMLRSNVILMHAAMATMMGGKEATGDFNRLLKGLDDGSQ